MAVAYSSYQSVILDLRLYTARKLGQPISLDMVPAVAKNRWTWLVSNWGSFYPTFKESTEGQDELENRLDLLDKEVKSFLLGSRLNPFDSLQKIQMFGWFLSIIPIDSLILEPSELIFIDQELERVSRLGVEDFKAMLTFMNSLVARFSQQIGLGDADAAALRGIDVQPKKRSATIADMRELESYIDVIKAIETIILDLRKSAARPPNLIAEANNLLAPASEVGFADVFRSYLPIPFEISLEHMSQKYLGDRNYWFEIAQVNGLRPPYIDEVGEKLSLKAPPAANNLVVGDSRKEDLTVGTKVGIGSHRYREETRVIERVNVNDDNTITLFLSGAANLSKFKPSEGAFIRVFKPGTTRVGQYILLPLPAASNLQSPPTPSSDELRRLGEILLSFGVDILRDERTNDFVVDSNGNFKFAAGLANARQAVLYALRTTRGELPFHPNYGVNINIGDTFYGTKDEAVVFGLAIRETILKDGRFSDAKIARLAVTGNSITLGLIVYLQGSNLPIPLAFVS